jgi:hypothetical protein
MKKLLIGLFLVAGLSAFSANQVLELKGGVDFGGKYDIDDIWNGGDAKTGLEIGAEYRYEVYPGLELGAGTAFQSHKKLKNGGEGFNSIPVYATAKYSFDAGSVKPYLKSDFGYSFNNNKFNNGFYYGAGVGVSYSNFNVELMYKENKSKYSSLFWDGNINYKRVTLGFGYNIPF